MNGNEFCNFNTSISTPMFKKLIAPEPWMAEQALAVVRIVLGLLVIYHGQEVFNPQLMNEYAGWGPFQGPGGKVMVYIGKSTELLAGVSLFLGVFTRVGALLLIGALTYITFFVGQGRFWYEDQHPFMFVLLGAIYFFYGPGAWSVDRVFKFKI